MRQDCREAAEKAENSRKIKQRPALIEFSQDGAEHLFFSGTATPTTTNSGPKSLAMKIEVDIFSLPGLREPKALRLSSTCARISRARCIELIAGCAVENLRRPKLVCSERYMARDILDLACERRISATAAEPKRRDRAYMAVEAREISPDRRRQAASPHWRSDNQKRISGGVSLPGNIGQTVTQSVPDATPISHNTRVRRRRQTDCIDLRAKPRGE